MIFLQVTFEPLFSKFAAKDILIIFCALLRERRIIVVSQSLPFLTSVINAIYAMTAPFTWQVRSQLVRRFLLFDNFRVNLLLLSRSNNPPFILILARLRSHSPEEHARVRWGTHALSHWRHEAIKDEGGFAQYRRGLFLSIRFTSPSSLLSFIWPFFLSLSFSTSSRFLSRSLSRVWSLWSRSIISLSHTLSLSRDISLPRSQILSYALSFSIHLSHSGLLQGTLIINADKGEFFVPPLDSPDDFLPPVQLASLKRYLERVQQSDKRTFSPPLLHMPSLDFFLAPEWYPTHRLLCGILH